jgi:hypothetical protein
VASIVGARATVLEYPGGKVEYFNFGSGLGKGGGLQQLIEGGWEPTLPEGLAILLTRAGGILARADLPGGWTAVSSAPQALVRHLEVYGKGPKLPADGAIARLAGAQARGACVLGVARSGKGLLGIYNTLLPIADALSPFLALAGVDPGQLPPAELFDEETRYAWLRLTLARDGFTFRGHRVLESSTGALVAASAAGIVAGFLVPTLLKGRSAAFDVQCGNNLKQLYVLAMQYSDKTPGRSFPHSPDGSLASLQLLIDGNEDAITSRLFLCPEGEESEAEDDDGKFELTEDTCSYEIVPSKLKNTTPDAILIYDKAPHHEGRRSVLFTDSRVELMEEEVFQARLEREQQKFAKTE